MKNTLPKIFSFPIRPHRHFRRLLMLLALFFVGVFACHVYLFYRIESDTIFATVATTATKVPVANEQKLTAVLDRYQTRATVRDSALKTPPAVNDPSR